MTIFTSEPSDITAVRQRRVPNSPRPADAVIDIAATGRAILVTFVSVGAASFCAMELTSELRAYLQQSRDGVLAALDGIGEFDRRRPLTPSGTNLLGLVKHLTGIEFGYLGDSVARPAPVLPWFEDGSVWENGDMWAKPDESSDELIALYHQAWVHSDESLAALPLDTPARVAWWPDERADTTFGSLVVRVIAETARHAGHCDIVRELIDGHAGSGHEEMGDAQFWAAYVAKVQDAADSFR